MNVFLVLSRAAEGVGERADDPALDEAHWSYMDRFAAGMVARGPLLDPDRERWAGSVHVLDLPDAAAVRAFVEDEPYHRAGAYREHVIRRFENRLGRTMWDFAGATGDPRFLVLADGPVDVLPPERLIVHGALSTLDGRPAGVVLALEAPSRAAVAALVGAERPGLEIHDWEFGGGR